MPSSTTEPKLSADNLLQEQFIPCTTPQAHASNLLLLPNGELLCAWFGGTQEGIPDISIYLSRRESTPTNVSDETWSTPSKITDDSTRSEQNPVLFLTPDGDELWIIYTSQDGGNQDTAIVKKQVSRDNGHTWSPPTILIDSPGTFIRQPMVVLKDGRWVLPVFHCRVEEGYKWIGNDDISAVQVSSNGGKTWDKTIVPESYGCVHMKICALTDGTYLGLFRSRWADNVYLSESENGIDWSPPRPTSLPNPNAGICGEVFPSGRIMLVYNHSSALDSKERRTGLYDDIESEEDTRGNQPTKHGKSAFWGAPRAPICVAVSDDGGATWKSSLLEGGDGYCMTNDSKSKVNRELSYPSCVLDVDGQTAHIAYTYFRQKIKYVRVSEDFVEKEGPLRQSSV